MTEREADIIIDALEDELEASRYARELVAGTWSRTRASRLPFTPA